MTNNLKEAETSYFLGEVIVELLMLILEHLELKLEVHLEEKKIQEEEEKVDLTHGKYT